MTEDKSYQERKTESNITSRISNLEQTLALALYERADSYLFKASTPNYLAAIQDLKRALALMPLSHKYEPLLEAYCKVNDFEAVIQEGAKALECYQREKERNDEPNPQVYLVPIYNLRALAFYKSGRYQEAINDLNTAIDFKPRKEIKGILYSNRGNSWFDLGKSDEAINDFTKAISYGIRDAETYNLRGVQFANKGNHKKAIRDYTKAISLDSSIEIFFRNRGHSYVDIGRTSEAIQDFNEAIKLNPKMSKAYSWRGNAFEKKGNAEAAVRDYQTSLEILRSKESSKELDKSTIFALVRVTEGLIRLGIDQSEALERYQKLLKQKELNKK